MLHNGNVLDLRYVGSRSGFRLLGRRGKATRSCGNARRRKRLLLESLEDRRLLAVLSGSVYDDFDGNGVRSADEAGVSGVSVYLDLDDSYTADNGEPIVISDGNGDYQFDNVADGEYVVRIQIPADYEQTSPIGATRLFATNESSIQGPSVQYELLEISPHDGTILNQVLLPTSATTVLRFDAGLAFDGETVFAFESRNRSLAELDPNTGEVLDVTSAPFANRNIGGMAAMNDLVYLLDITSVTAAPALLAFDPLSDQVVSSVQYSFGHSDALGAIESENLLVSASSANVLTLFSPTSPDDIVERVLVQIPQGQPQPNVAPRGISFAGGEFFVSYAQEGVYVFNRSGQFLRRLSDPAEGFDQFRCFVDQYGRSRGDHQRK